MRPAVAAEIRVFLLEQVSDRLAAAGLSKEMVSDDFDLRFHGVLDSLALLEVITAIEERFGVEMDFEDVSVEDITVVGPFCRHVERRIAMETR